MSPGVARRGGVSLLETLVALLLGLLLVHLVLRTVGAAGDAVESHRTRSDRLAAVRMARWRAAADVAAAGSAYLAGEDSVALRAVRGGIVGCGLAGGIWTGRGEGVRLPDPDKDSVLVLLPSGRWSVHALASLEVPVGTCGPGGEGATWGLVLDPPPPASPVVGRFFERGSYHLADGALRWRRGAGGRQPLTPEVLAGRGGAVEEAGTGLVFRLRFRRPSRAGGAVPSTGWRVPATTGGGSGG